MLHVADRIVTRTIDTTETKGKLIAIGERLMGERGFSVAMHEIAQQAGQANKYAIQYHFGDRDGLVAAIFQTRQRFIVERREELLRLARKKGVLRSVPALLEIMYLPITEQVDLEGRHSFARFWLQYNVRPESVGLADNPFTQDATQFNELVARLASALKADPAVVMRNLQFLGWIHRASLIDREANPPETREPLEPVFLRAIELIAGGLKAGCKSSLPPRTAPETKAPPTPKISHVT